ncbi:MAG: MFS transporter [Anaerolineaceae bacterium]|nr:MFS transporter [Anaerolineaceae bacterium]
MTALSSRLSKAPRELKLFVAASLVMGMGYSLFDSIFNNFLNENYALTGFQRSFLEFPRELPGFLTIFITALFWFLCSRRLGGMALLFSAAGVLLIAYVSPSYGIMVLWLFLYSAGQHVFMPIASTIGMELAREGQAGRRLGQLNAVRNFAAIFGSALVFVGFRYLGMTFQLTFTLAAVGFVIAAVLLFSMQRGRPQPSGEILKLKKEYRLYYILAVLYGSRKQLFITFAPWVLVTVFNQPTQTLATLITVGGIIGIIFQPILGRAIDRFGERTVLISEAVLLVFVCFGYGFARSFLPEGTAFLVVCGCYLLDQMLMSVSMARSTYMKKIALKPDDIQPALAAGVSIDHIFSISLALLGGVIWNQFGYQYVFLMGVVIAAINIFAASHIRLPKQLVAIQAEPEVA